MFLKGLTPSIEEMSHWLKLVFLKSLRYQKPLNSKIEKLMYEKFDSNLSRINLNINYLFERLSIEPDMNMDQTKNIWHQIFKNHI